MPSYVPCKKNDANGYIFYVSLISQSSPKTFQANPTLAAGDVKRTIDDGAPSNLNTLPAVDADFTKRVKVTLNQAETNGDNITIIFSDAAGDEWGDLTINIQTAAQTLDELDTNVDDIETYVKHGTYGLAALDNDLGTLLTRLSAARAGYLDELDFGLTEAIAALPDAAAINAEVVDALGTDTLSELAQGIPAATPTIKAAIMLLYMIARNKLTTTASELGIHNDAGTKIAKKALADDDTTYEESEMISGV